MFNVLLALYSRLIFLVFSLTQPRHHYHHHTKKNIVKKITNVAYIFNEWCACVLSIVIYINNIKYCGIIHYELLLMQLKKDIKSVQLLPPQKRRPQQQHSIFLVLLHQSLNNSHQSFQLLNFNLFAESRAKPRLVPNSQRTTANHTFPPAQVI